MTLMRKCRGTRVGAPSVYACSTSEQVPGWSRKVGSRGGRRVPAGRQPLARTVRGVAVGRVGQEQLTGFFETVGELTSDPPGQAGGDDG